MNKLFKRLVLTGISATLLAIVPIPNNNGIIINNLSSTKLIKAENIYVTPITIYPISTGKDIIVYNNTNDDDVDSNSKIYGSDKCTILKFYNNGFCEVKYPDKNNDDKIRYAKTSSFIYKPKSCIKTVKIKTNTKVYRRSNLSQQLGTTYTTDTIYLVSTKGSSSQIIYNIDNGWKCGWIPSNAIKQKTAIADGTYYIIPKCAPDKVLDIYNAGKSDNDNLNIYDKSSKNKNQKFKVTNLGDGTYMIKACHSGKVLDVNSGIAKSGTNVSQYEWNETNAQRWIIKDEGDGWCSIISKLDSNLYLDVQEGSNDNYANVQVYDKNNTDAQRFRFEATNV